MRSRISSWRAVIFLVVASLVLSLTMMRGGYIMGGGEAGAQFANLAAMKDSCSFAWADIALGINYTAVSSSCPYYMVLGAIEKTGISGYDLQVGFHFICIFMALAGISLLIKTYTSSEIPGFFPELVSGLFYVSNPFAIVNIWNRFLPNVVVFYCVLPLLIYLARVYQKNHQLWVAAGFGILGAISAYGFTGPAQTVLFWGLITLILFLNRRAKFSETVGTLFVLVIFWVAANFWWLASQYTFSHSQYFKVSTEEFFTASGNIDSLISISERLGKVFDLLLLRHVTFFENSRLLPYSWPNIFNAFPVKLMYTAVLISSVFMVIQKKIKIGYVGIVLLTLGVLVSKGTNPPIGLVFGWLFSKITLLEFFRNPVEKLGFITSLGWTLLVAAVCIHAISMKKASFKILPTLIVSIQLIPFLSGLIYTSPFPPGNNEKIGNRVEIPAYYSSVNTFLDSDPSDDRIMVTPQGNEGITYKWNIGYNGVEQSAILFSKPALSYSTSIPYFRNISKQLEYQLLYQKKFENIAHGLGINYIVYRPDIDATNSGTRVPNQVLDILSQQSEIKELSQGNNYLPLKVYKVNDSSNQRLFLTNTAICSNSPDDLDNFSLFSQTKATITLDLSDEGKMEKCDKTIFNRSIFKKTEYLPQQSSDSRYFPHVRNSPGTTKYYLSLLKEKVQALGKLKITEKAEFQIMISGKRLKELSLLPENTDEETFTTYFNKYRNTIPSVLKIVVAIPKSTGEDIWRKQDLAEAFTGHLYELDSLKKHFPRYVTFIDSQIVELKRELIMYKVIPAYQFSKSLIKGDGLVYQFLVNEAGEYTFIVPHTANFPKEFIVPERVGIYINGKQVDTFTQTTNSGLSFGTHHFEKGVNEVYIPQLASPKLFSIKAHELRTNGGETIEEFGPFNIDTRLKYSFYSQTTPIVGQGVRLSIIEDTSPKNIETGSQQYSIDKYLGFDDYSFGSRVLSTTYAPSPSTSTIKLKISINQWNNCLSSFINEPKKCTDKALYDTFNRKSISQVDETYMQANMPEKAVLITQGQDMDPRYIDLKYNKQRPVGYSATLPEAESKIVLAQLDTYDSGWVAYLNGKKLDESQHILVNGYANGWIMPKGASGNISIEFQPNQSLNLYYKVTLGIVSILVAVLLLSLFKNIHESRS